MALNIAENYQKYSLAVHGVLCNIARHIRAHFKSKSPRKCPAFVGRKDQEKPWHPLMLQSTIALPQALTSTP
jgi:hypothetical protein